MRVPIKQLEQYGDKHGFSDAIRRFASACIRKSKGYHEIFIVNLHQINKEIGKTRGKGAYVRGTLCLVRQKLFNTPSFKIVNQHSPYVFEIKILPLCQKLPEAKENLTEPDDFGESEKEDVRDDTEIAAEDAGIDPQQLIYADRKCRSAGIKFDKKDLWRVARHPKELIDRAIQHYKFAVTKNHIPSPTGWLLCNLRDKWYLNFHPEKHIASIQEQFFRLQDTLIETFGSIPKRDDGDFFRGFCPKKRPRSSTS